MQYANQLSLSIFSTLSIFSCPHMKQWFSFYLPKYGDLYEILDAAKVGNIHVQHNTIFILSYVVLVMAV